MRESYKCGKKWREVMTKAATDVVVMCCNVKPNDLSRSFAALAKMDRVEGEYVFSKRLYPI